MNLLTPILLFLSFWCLPPQASSSTHLPSKYVTWQVDYQPIKAMPKEYARFQKLVSKSETGVMTRADFYRQLEVLQKVLKVSPGWHDGYWMVGSTAFQLGSTYTDEDDLPEARRIFVLGKRATEKCLKIKRDHPPCMLFLGSVLGKIGTIDGVFSSLGVARRIEELWLRVAASPYNLRFTEGISMQGAVRYGLGIFYRLVPDYAVLDWVYGVRGDLEKSVRYHRESLAIDDPTLPCSHLMLGAALVCSVEDTSSVERQAEARRVLQRASLARGKSLNARICKRDAAVLMKNPDLACGYSTTRQQERVSEESLAH